MPFKPVFIRALDLTLKGATISHFWANLRSSTRHFAFDERDIPLCSPPFLLLHSQFASRIDQNDDRSALKSLRTFTPIKNDRSMEGSSFISPLFCLVSWFTSSE
jgi:hypothetical protein